MVDSENVKCKYYRLGMVSQLALLWMTIYIYTEIVTRL